MNRKFIVFILPALLVIAIQPTAVFAHAELVTASPAPGVQLAEPPSEIRLVFSEPVASGSEILLLAGSFAPVAGIEAAPDVNQPEQLVARLPALAGGAYTVQWTALSADGHEITGSYSFTVGEVESSRSDWTMLLAAAAVLTAVILGAAAVWRARR